MTPRRRKILRSATVLGIAVLVAIVLVMLKRKPEKQPPVQASLLVDIIHATASSPTMTIRSYGTVRPIESLNLISEVRGRVVELASSFNEGGFFEQGGALIRIDPRSYELAVAQRKKQLKQLDAQCSRLEQEKKNLQTSLKIGRDELELAKAEWQRFRALAKREVAAQTTLDQAEQKYLASRNRVQEIENQIALIDPSADQVKAQRELVEVQLKEALLDLDRTRIKAPYSGRVLEKGVEKGQFVTAGSFLGRIYRASAMEVEVHVAFRDLKWLGDSVWSANDTASNPKGKMSGKAVAARVIFDSGGKLSTWDGRLARIKAEVDEKTRTLPLVIEVPLEGASKHPSSSYPLMPGMFVTVELMGVKIDRAYLLPRSAVHPGDVVYVSENGRLAVRSVEVIRRLNNSVYVGEGLKDGDLVIVTPISVPKEGMKVKVRQKSA